MNPTLYPRRRPLDHSTPWGVEYPEFFITLCCASKGRNQLCWEGVGQRILNLIRKYQLSRRWHCSIALLMPDHLHAIVQIPQKLPIVEVIRCFKQTCAKQASIAWQRDFFDHRLRGPASSQQTYRYIEMNPVRAGFITHPNDWPWRINFNDHGEEIEPSSSNLSIGQAAESACPYRNLAD